MPTRFYVAVGVNRKGQKGGVSDRQGVALAPPPPAPSDLVVTYTATALVLAWTPGAETGAFNVYEVPPPPPVLGGATIPIPPAAAGQLPIPVHPKPLPGPPFVDSRVAFGTTRCYVVRAVSVLGARTIESEASPARCVTPADTFPPAAPASLTAIGGAGAISLIWDASLETDLGGYLVMRATLPGGDFVPVTPAPIAQTTFNDTTVARGVRYAYVVLGDRHGRQPQRSVEPGRGGGEIGSRLTAQGSGGGRGGRHGSYLPDRVSRVETLRGRAQRPAVPARRRPVRRVRIWRGDRARRVPEGPAGGVARARAGHPVENRRDRAQLQGPRGGAEEAAAGRADAVHQAVHRGHRPGRSDQAPVRRRPGRLRERGGGRDRQARQPRAARAGAGARPGIHLRERRHRPGDAEPRVPGTRT